MVQQMVDHLDAAKAAGKQLHFYFGPKTKLDEKVSLKEESFQLLRGYVYLIN